MDSNLLDHYQEICKEFPSRKQQTPLTDLNSFLEESKASAKMRLRGYLDDTLAEFLDTNVLTADEFYQVFTDAAHDYWQFYQLNADQSKKLLDLLQ